MSDEQIFGGDWVSGTDLEDWAEETLRAFLPDFLGRMDRQSGRHAEGRKIPQPKTWGRSNEFDNYPDDAQLPAILFVSGGLAGRPVKLDGAYKATWLLGVGIVVGANNAKNTEILAKHYAATVRAALVNNPSLMQRASGLDWIDERYDDMSVEDSATLGVARLVFEVTVDRVVDVGVGPTAPSEAPDEEADDWPVVETVHLEVTPTGV